MIFVGLLISMFLVLTISYLAFQFLQFKERREIEEKYQNKTLKSVSKIRFNDENYIFINKRDGSALVSNGKLLPQGKKLWDIFGEDVNKMVDDKKNIENVLFQEREQLKIILESMNKNAKYDAVITDLMTNGNVGGKEAIQLLLEIDPDAKVLVSSGYSMDPVVTNFKDYGFKGCIIKPFKIEDLKKLYQKF